jgi:hypothetical protein
MDTVTDSPAHKRERDAIFRSAALEAAAGSVLRSAFSHSHILLTFSLSHILTFSHSHSVSLSSLTYSLTYSRFLSHHSSWVLSVSLYHSHSHLLPGPPGTSTVNSTRTEMVNWIVTSFGAVPASLCQLRFSLIGLSDPLHMQIINSWQRLVSMVSNSLGHVVSNSVQQVRYCRPVGTRRRPSSVC